VSAVSWLILLTADAHSGARLGAFFYCTRFFLKTVYHLTIPLWFLSSVCSGN